MTAATNVSRMPPEALQLLNDPRLADMVDGPSGIPQERILPPAIPPDSTESKFLLVNATSEGIPGGRVTWVNDPGRTVSMDHVGYGLGFARLEQVPHFEHQAEKPKQPSEVWSYLNWFIASQSFVQILRGVDPDAVQTKEMDWVFSDGQRLDGYMLLDITRVIDAYDFRRTAVIVGMDRGRKYIARLAEPRTLRDIPEDVHMFRTSAYRSDVFMSRMLAGAISAAKVRGIYFLDPRTMRTVVF